MTCGEPNTMIAIPAEKHNALVKAAYLSRGFDEEEAEAATRMCESAARHGVRTHNAIKALHLDDLFGSTAGGCRPGARIEVLDDRFLATETWNAHKKLGQAVAYAAIDRCIELADQFGVGTVAVDNAFHYLWGGGYVLDAALRGYIAYTNCTSTLAEVVPFKGKFPTLGTNPHSWGLPTQDACGFPVIIDWATSTVSMGRVQQFKREGKELPPDAAVDSHGRPTTDPKAVASLLPFGAHKGYGLSLINEIFAAFIGGSTPTLRGRAVSSPEKNCATFYFQVIHPEAISGKQFANGRSQMENLDAVMKDILGHGNEECMLPGQPEAEAARACEQAGGLLFSAAEIAEFNEIAEALGLDPLG